MGLFSFIKDLNKFLCSEISIAKQKAKEFDEEVTARCAENTVELVKRTKKAEQDLKDLGFENVTEAHEYIQSVYNGITKKK